MSPANSLSQRCSARSKRTGAQCGQWVTHGATVCKWHGGAAPQVKEAAMARLLKLQHPAIDRMSQLIEQTEFPTVSYAASRDVLDRTIGKPGESMDLRHSGNLTLAQLLGVAVVVPARAWEGDEDA